MGFLGCLERLGSDLPDVGRLGAFLALGDLEAHAIAFGEGFESVSLNSGEVNEYVRTVVLLDKPETLGVVEPLHGTLCHLFVLLFSLVGLFGVVQIPDATETKKHTTKKVCVFLF